MHIKRIFSKLFALHFVSTLIFALNIFMPISVMAASSEIPVAFVCTNGSTSSTKYNADPSSNTCVIKSDSDIPTCNDKLVLKWKERDSGQIVASTPEALCSFIQEQITNDAPDLYFTAYEISTKDTYKCNAGYYLLGGSTSCVTCDAGYYCPGGRWEERDYDQGMLSCSGDTWSSEGFSSCHDCPTDYKIKGRSHAYQSSCTITVEAGFYYDSDGSKHSCPNGTYSATEHEASYGVSSESTACIPCPIGTISGSGGDDLIGRRYCATCSECYTTTAPGSTYCGLSGSTECNCPNKSNVTSWNAPKWENNTAVDICSVASCGTGYHVDGTAGTESSFNCTLNTFNIAYNANGGTGNAPSSPTVCTYNTTCNAPTTANTTYTRTGFAFDGWVCTGGDTGGICDNTSIAAGGSIKNATATHNKTITLTAQWEPNTYNIYAYLVADTANGIKQAYDAKLAYSSAMGGLLTSYANPIETILKNNVPEKYTYSWANNTKFDIYSQPVISDNNKLGTVTLSISSSNQQIYINSGDIDNIKALPNNSNIYIHIPIIGKPYNVYMISSGVTDSGLGNTFNIHTTPIVQKKFGSEPSDGVTPNKSLVTTCISDTNYAYIPDTATPQYYECTNTNQTASKVANTSNGSATMFEPSKPGNNICIAYQMTTCEAGYSCNSCQRTNCYNGQYQPNAGQAACAPCPAGSVSANDNQPHTSCTNCYNGQYQPNAGQASCDTCPSGSYTTNENKPNSECVGCPAGTYGDGTKCDPCPAGTYQPYERKTTCISCQDGTTTATDAISGLFTTDVGATVGATAREQCYIDKTITFTDAQGSGYLLQKTDEKIYWRGK